jgi:glycosyltransferase involved in cell wall biosynthesis
MFSTVEKGKETSIGTGKKNLLFIPHTPPAAALVTRGEALARGLADHFNVHLLSWRHDATGRSSAPARALSSLAGMVTKRKVSREGNVALIETPFLYIRRPGTEPLRRINTAIVNGIIVKHGIHIVVNQLALVNSRDLRRPHIIDIVDLPSPREMARWSRQAVRAVGITTITGGLRGELAGYGMEAEVIGNGADFDRFRSAHGEKIRTEFGLKERFVIGYIGNHAEWSGLQFLLDVFKKLKVEMADAVLLVVGPGSEVPGARTRTEAESIQDVVFTGPVDASHVAEYFKAIDVGVLPFTMDPHAALSFPIKVIEYSAARKVVVASPLNVLKEIGLPNVNLVDREVDRWVDALIGARARRWDDKWDAQVEQYDWRNLSARLAAYITSRIP